MEERHVKRSKTSVCQSRVDNAGAWIFFAWVPVLFLPCQLRISHTPQHGAAMRLPWRQCQRFAGSGLLSRCMYVLEAIAIGSTSPPIQNVGNLFSPKTETNLTTDYSDYTDTIGYDYLCPEVLLRKDSYAHPRLLPENLCNRRNLWFSNFVISG